MAENNEPENNNNPEPSGDPTPESGAGSGEPGDNWRNEPGAKAMAQQISELRAQIAETKSAQEKAAEESERNRLEEEGKYKELANSERQKREAAEQAFAAKERRLTLEAKLSGIQNDLTRKGAIAECPEDADVDEYVTKLRADYPDLFAAPGILPASTPQQGGPSAGGAKSQDLEARLKYDDPQDPAGSAVIRAQARGEKAKAGGYSRV